MKTHLVDKDHIENQPPQIILTIDLIVLKFEVVLIIDILDIQFNSESSETSHGAHLGPTQ